MSNLRLINESSGSSLSSYSVQDVFTSDFDIYQIEITEFQQTATFSGGMRFINSSGSVISSSDYEWARLSLRSYGSFIDDKNTSDTDIQYIVGSATTSPLSSTGASIWVFNPTNSSSYTFMMFQNVNWLVGSGIAGSKAIAVLKTTASITGFNIYSTGTMGSIKTKHYGLRVDS